MEFELLRAAPDRSHIQSYGPEGFLVSGVRYHGCVLVLARRVEPLALKTLTALAPAMLEVLRQEEVDLLLLGTGSHFAVPPREVLAALRSWGIAVEPMTTAAACRTFDLLMAEDRRVAALLLPLAP